MSKPDRNQIARFADIFGAFGAEGAAPTSTAPPRLDEPKNQSLLGFRRGSALLRFRRDHQGAVGDCRFHVRRAGRRQICRPIP